MPHHKVRFRDAIVWVYPEAPLDVARVLGEIAADLWLSGRLPLTSDHTVATVGPDAALEESREDGDDQVPGDRGRSQAVA